MTLDVIIYNNTEEIKCKYYEIEEKCVDIVKRYCNCNEENNLVFQKFAHNYKTFKPYFDFVVCYLGYKIQNICLEGKHKVLFGKDNKMYVYDKSIERCELNYRFTLSDDKTLNIKPLSFSETPYHECVIMGNKDICPQNFLGHEQMFGQILNNLLITSSEVCKDYLDYDNNVGFFITRYLPIIWFQSEITARDLLTRSVYYENNLTDDQKLFIEYLLDNRFTYPSFLSKIEDFLPFDAKDYSNLLRYEERDDLKYGKK